MLRVKKSEMGLRHMCCWDGWMVEWLRNRMLAVAVGRQAMTQSEDPATVSPVL